MNLFYLPTLFQTDMNRYQKKKKEEEGYLKSMRSINKFTGLICINTNAKDFLLETVRQTHADRHTHMQMCTCSR